MMINLQYFAASQAAVPVLQTGLARRSLRNCDWTLVYWACQEFSRNEIMACVHGVTETSSRLGGFLVWTIVTNSFPLKCWEGNLPLFACMEDQSCPLCLPADKFHFPNRSYQVRMFHLAVIALSVVNLTVFPIILSISRDLSAILFLQLGVESSNFQPFLKCFFLRFLVSLQYGC